MTDKPQAPKAEAKPEATAEAQDEPSSETVPGGRYLLNGKLVNANGEELKDKK